MGLVRTIRNPFWHRCRDCCNGKRQVQNSPDLAVHPANGNRSKGTRVAQRGPAMKRLAIRGLSLGSLALLLACTGCHRRIGEPDDKNELMRPDEVVAFVYMQEIPASVQSTINSINSELRKSDKQSQKKSKESVAAGTVVSSRRKPSARVTQNDTKSWKGGSAPPPAYA